MKRNTLSANRRFFLSLFAVVGLAFMALMWKGALPGGATSAREATAVPLAATPALNLSDFPGMALVGETFCYTARITNTGDLNGPSPYLQLNLPPGVTIDSVVAVGICGNSSSCTPTSTYSIAPIDSGIFNGGGTAADVLSGKTVTGVPNNHLWLLQPPIGLLTPFSTTTQSIDLRICLRLDANAAINSLQKICHRPVFLLSNTASIEGAEECKDVMASLFKLTKRAPNALPNDKTNAPPLEVATGFCHPIDFELVVDIASGKTLTDAVFKDTFSTYTDINGIIKPQFVRVTTTPVTVNGSGNGVVVTNLSGLTGFEVTTPGVSYTGSTGAQDVVVRFQAYATLQIDGGQCMTREATNTAMLNAKYLGLAVTAQTDQISFEVKHLIMQKTATPQQAMPGDEVTYTVRFQIAEDVIAEYPAITDFMPDGVTYVANSSFLSGNINGVPITSLSMEPTNQIPQSDGSTKLEFLNLGTPFQFGKIGACSLAVLTYKGTVNQNHNPPNATKPLVAADKLENKALIEYKKFNSGILCAGSSGESATATSVIKPPQIEKSIVNPKLEYSAGDEVTFKLKMCLPSGDAKQVMFTDFLPPQLFDATAVDLSSANIKLTVLPSGVTPAITLTPPPTASALDNSLMFSFAQGGQSTLTTNGTQPLCLEIEFKAKIKTGALPDKKDFANLFQGKVLDSGNVAFVQQAGIVLNLAQPKPELKITKTVCDTPDTSDAGDKVTFCITVKNESAATAYNAKVTDIVPAEMSYVSNSLVQVGNTPSLTLDFQNPSTTGLMATANTLNPGQSFSIKFMATLKDVVVPCKTYTNTADISWTASSGSTTIITGQSAKAKVTIASPTITKTLKEPSTAAHTTPPEVAIGEENTYEVKVCLPEGTTPKVRISDFLPNLQCTGVKVTGLFTGNLPCPGPWEFNNVVVPGDNDTANNCITLEIKMQVKDKDSNNNLINFGCAQNQTEFQNKASVETFESNLPLCGKIDSNSVRSRVVEPFLSINKDFIPATAKPGDMVTIKLTLSNKGNSSCPTSFLPTSSAFDVELQDKLASNFTNVVPVTTPAGFTYSYNLGANEVKYTSAPNTEVKPGDMLEFTFKATVQKPCNMVPNTAFIAQASTMKGNVVGERKVPIVQADAMSTATLTIAGGSCGCADPAQITNNILPNMIGWWPFDDGAGASVVKEIAKNYSGKPYTSAGVSTTINGTGGPTQSLNQFVTSSFTFANASYVNVPDNNDLDIGTNDFTIDAWIRPPAGSPPASVPIVVKVDTNTQKGYGLYYEPSGKLRLLIGSPLQSYTSTAALTLAQAQWQFVAVTVRRQPSQVTFYVNSNPPDVITAPAVTTASIANNKDLRLGPGQIVLPGQGVILDEVEIFNTALPPDKIDLIRKAQEIGKCKDNTCLTNPIKILATTLPGGKKGQFYSKPILVSGGVSPYMFELILGSLPKGLNLDKNTGVISGTPEEAGSSTFQIKITDARGCMVTGKFSMGIKQGLIGLEYNVTSTARFAGQDAAAQQNGTLTLSVNLEALGNEKAVGFSLSYDPALLSNPVVTLGPGAPGATLLTNTSQTGQGRLGILLTMPGNQTFTEGLLQVARVSFGLVLKSPAPVTKIEFGDTPTTRSVSDASGNRLETQYESTPAVLAPKVVTVSAANYAGDRLASEQIVAAFGTNLATGVQIASGATLPTTLLGTTVKVIDSAGVERLAPLFFVAPTQINYLLPAGLALGTATVSITSGNGAASGGVIKIAAVSPGIFTADASGRGFPAANLFRLRADGSSVIEPVVVFDPAQGKLVPKPIDVGEEGDRIFLILFATAVQGRSNLSAVEVTIGGLPTDVSYAGPQGGFFGLDQLNIEIPRSLAGQGLVDVLLTVDGVVANVVQISIL